MLETLALWTQSDMHAMQKGDSKKNKWQLAVVIKQPNAAN